MDKTYKLEIAGLTRELPVFQLSDDLCIAGFVIFGDAELTCACASELIKIMPEHDIIITAEAKSIPLVHEIARQTGENRYIVARKAIKVYMKEPYGVEVHSITTAKKQHLYIDKTDMEEMKGKRVLIVDDVISTGESLRAVEKLVKVSGGIIAGKMAILAEGDAKYRDDIKYLEYLPLLDKDGRPKQ